MMNPQGISEVLQGGLIEQITPIQDKSVIGRENRDHTLNPVELASGQFRD